MGKRSGEEATFERWRFVTEIYTDQQQKHPQLRRHIGDLDAGRDFRCVRTASGLGGVLGSARAFPEDNGAARGMKDGSTPCVKSCFGRSQWHTSH